MTQLDISNVIPLGFKMSMEPFMSSDFGVTEQGFIDGCIFKNIPIQFLAYVQKRLKGQASTGMYFRYRFRGPRFDMHKGHTTKVHANRFSVYHSTKQFHYRYR